ncbi:MAG: serine/threonine protein kinase [Gammaproteobacteria bacterium]
MSDRPDIAELLGLDPIDVTATRDLLATVVRNQGAAGPVAKPAAPNEAERPRYHLMGKLGAGGMGEIQVARDRDLGRKVAFKQLHARAGERPTLTQRFLLEAQVTAQLDHPNVVPVYALEYGEDGRIGYAMKLVRGHTLQELLEKSRLAIKSGQRPSAELDRAALLDHFLKVCDAIAYAHAKGVIHRDLKPANIMIGAFREVYVMDWGIAKVVHAPTAADDSWVDTLDGASADPAATRTRVGDVVGTPSYMSPEQARGENRALDERSDLYSLGLILQEILTLRRALSGTSAAEVMDNARRGDKQPLAAPAAALVIPEDLAAIVRRATAPPREDRYPDVTSFAADIRAYLRGDPVSVLRETWQRRLLRWIGRHRQTTLLILLGAILLGATATAWSLYRHAHAIAAAQAHELALSRALLAVDEQAYNLQSYLANHNTLLSGLASAAVQALDFGQPSSDTLYFSAQFDDPPQAPADTAPAPRYLNRPISLGQPVYVVRADTDTPATQAMLRRLVPLSGVFRQLFLTSANSMAKGNASQIMGQLLNNPDMPLLWAYVALEDGVFIAYPGSGGYPADYDATQRPWYQLAARRQGIWWGHPYRSTLTGLPTMACATALYDARAQFRGVAALILRLDALQNRLAVAGLPMLRAYLLDQEGHTLIRSDHPLSPSAALDTELYPEATVVAALAKGESGYLERERAGEQLLVVYNDLEGLGLGYVVELAALATR